MYTSFKSLEYVVFQSDVCFLDPKGFVRKVGLNGARHFLSVLFLFTTLQIRSVYAQKLYHQLGFVVNFHF